MAVMSFANAMAQLARGIKVLDQLDKAIQTNSSGSITNFIAVRDTVIAALAGEHSDGIVTALEGLQRSLVGALTPEAVQGFLLPFVNEVTQAIDGDFSGFASQLIDIRDYMDANSQTVLRRLMSYGTISAGGGNVGNAAFYQLTVDKHGSQLQSPIAESLLIECVSDQGTGAKRNAEVWRYKGDATRDGVTAGSGLREDITGSYDQNNKISNPRFESYSGTAPTAGSPVTPASTTALSNYVLSATLSFSYGLDNVTRIAQGRSAQARSLKFVANGNFYQKLSDRSSIFSSTLPYLVAALVYKPTGADGTLTLAWGSKSQAFTVSSLTNDTWQWLIVDRDADLFYDNWKQDDTRLTVTLGSASTFNVVVQEIGIYEPELINGVWWWVLGLNTVASRGDTFTQTISQSSDGINQRWLSNRSGISDSLAEGFSLPSAASSSETVADA